MHSCHFCSATANGTLVGYYHDWTPLYTNYACEACGLRESAQTNKTYDDFGYAYERPDSTFHRGRFWPTPEIVQQEMQREYETV